MQSAVVHKLPDNPLIRNYLYFIILYIHIHVDVSVISPMSRFLHHRVNTLLYSSGHIVIVLLVCK